MVEPLLRELKAGGPPKTRVESPRDHPKQILTNEERRKLAAWILACAAGQKPKDRVEVSAKVKQMLRARHTSNKQRNYRAGTIRLNEQELAAVRSRPGSGAPIVGPRRGCARLGRALLPASPSCSATRPLWPRPAPSCAERVPSMCGKTRSYPRSGGGT